MTAIRLPVSFVLALCATATLFWFLGMLVAADPNGTFVPITRGMPLINGGREVTTRTGSDRGPGPQVRMLPEYPEQAKQRGIEGWITFRFTVAVDGSVEDIEIVDSQPPRTWDSATLRAVSTWKYSRRSRTAGRSSRPA